MKTKIIILILFLFIFLQVFAENCKFTPDTPEYAVWKQSQVRNPDMARTSKISEPTYLRNNQNLLIPWDASFILAMPPNDDNSTTEIFFPFTFSMFGETFNSCFINNNGNVSFVSPYSTFSSVGFPSADYKMLAPFWGDVDTRGAGSVWYKIEAHRFTVIWDAVGYFGNQIDKLNTFELVFSDGTDPILGLGYWAGFSYDVMQWTTGSASNGVGGFLGDPATVGVNKGDGTNYFQIGQFDHPGSDYDGPGGAADGVSYLDGQLFRFGGTGGNNTPPVFLDIPVVPVVLNLGASTNLTIDIISPEIGENTDLVVTHDFTSGFTYEIVPGNPASVTFHITQNAGNVGNHVITITATDNGVPPQTSIQSFTVEITDSPYLPVELSSFTAIATSEDFLSLTWVTQSESGMLGYNVYRNGISNFGTSSQLNQAVIPAHNTTTTQTYNLVDPEVENGQTYYYWLEGVDFDGTSNLFGPLSAALDGSPIVIVPQQTAMDNNYPNPFRMNDNTNVNVRVKEGTTATINIYNILGQSVKMFNLNQGNHTLTWDGKDSKGNFCGSGVYFYSITSPDFIQTKKMVILK